MWTGKSAAPERTLFWEWRSERAEMVAAMCGQFKLVVNGGGRPELYDVIADPAERRDVSAEHPELTTKLHNELTAWLNTEAHR